MIELMDKTFNSKTSCSNLFINNIHYQISINNINTSEFRLTNNQLIITEI